MPCPPGLRPVTKVDHATGLCGGFAVPRDWKLPCSASFVKFGMTPFFMSRSRISGSIPSTPRTNTPVRSDDRSWQPTNARRRSARSGKPLREPLGTLSLTGEAVDEGSRSRPRLRKGAGMDWTLDGRPSAGLGEDHPALHRAGHGLPEETEHGSGDVGDVRTLDGDRAVAEEHARHDVRIDAVVSRPALRVVREDLLGHRAGRALPGVPIAALVAHEEIGSIVAVGPVRAGDRRADLADAALAAHRIDQRLELPHDLGDQRDVRVPLLDDAGLLAALPIDEEAGQTEAEGAG